MELLIGLKDYQEPYLTPIEMTKPSFPVVSFNTDGSLEFYYREEVMQKINLLSLKVKSFKILRLVDSNLDSWTVTAAQKVGSHGPLWGFDIFMNHKILVKYSYSKEGNLDLQVFKDKLMKSVLRNKFIFDQLFEINDFMVFIDSAKSSFEIFEFLRSKLS